MKIHERLRKLRTESGMTQQEVADKLGYSTRSAIARIESGSIDLPQSKILAFANLFGTTTDYILYGKQEEEQTFAKILLDASEGLTQKELNEVLEFIRFKKAMHNDD